MQIKSIIFSALFVLSTVVSVVANVGPTGLAVLSAEGSEVFKVVYKGEGSGRVRLNLYDAQSTLIFSETITADGFIRPLNFSGLAFGEYTIELVDRNGKKVEKINYRPAKVAAKHVRISRLADTEGKFLLSVSNKAVNETINVKIYNANNLIYNETKRLDGDFAQLYAVKVAGELVFEVTDKQGNVTKARF